MTEQEATVLVRAIKRDMPRHRVKATIKPMDSKRYVKNFVVEVYNGVLERGFALTDFQDWDSIRQAWTTQA